MTLQNDKYQLGIAGEFFVAAQLQRLGVTASVTYGNAKRADVLAVARVAGRAVAIEVKSSSKSRWPIGRRVPPPSTQPWVFVHFPIGPYEPPEFYVLLQSELHAICAPEEEKYMRKFMEKNGREYGEDTAGVAAAKRSDLIKYKNNWQCILELIAA